MSTGYCCTAALLSIFHWHVHAYLCILHHMRPLVGVCGSPHWQALTLLPLLLSCVCRSASSFKEAMRMGSEVYHNLKAVIKEKYGERGEGTRRAQAATHCAWVVVA